MKVRAKTTIQALYDENLVTIFVKDKIYNANKNTNIDWCYEVINEVGERNLYCRDAFKSYFKESDDSNVL